MTDIVDAATRSRMMAGIRSKNTKPELRVRSRIHRAGLRFRLHRRSLPGTPDLVLPRFHLVLFVHGCFWHGHDCRLGVMPATRAEFWRTKIRSNRERDQRQQNELRTLGWTVYTVWECSLDSDTDKLIATLKA